MSRSDLFEKDPIRLVRMVNEIPSRQSLSHYPHEADGAVGKDWENNN